MIFSNENNALRIKIAAGVDMLANAVKVTLGPSGRNVAIRSNRGYPVLTKDGVSVAEQVQYPEDPIMDLGIQMVKEAASMANRAGGDGTTTATVLAQAVIADTMAHHSDVNPMQLKAGIDRASFHIQNQLESLALPCSDLETLTKVATISANGDRDIADLIAGTVYKYRDDLDSIMVTKGNSPGDYLEEEKGYIIKKGLVDGSLASDSNGKLELTKGILILINGPLEDAADLHAIFTMFDEHGGEFKSLTIIAESFSKEVIARSIGNNNAHTVKVALIKSPEFAMRRTFVMGDLAAYTDGTIFTEASEVSIDKCGTYDVLNSNMSGTRIAQKKMPNQKLVDERVGMIRDYLAQGNLEKFDIEHCHERISKLTVGTGRIVVGGNTELEVRERFDRFVDALNASINAYKRGVVPGGGAALLWVAEKLKETDLSENKTDFNLGYEIAIKAIQAPFHQIFNNAAIEVGDHADKVKEIHQAYNLVTDEHGHCLEVGVIDPLAVTMSSVNYALNVAGMILTTEAAVIN
tara:strand:- start:3436 stop:5001 length:1566 start_codon:yes stop_codon:yes gene_type:complete